MKRALSAIAFVAMSFPQMLFALDRLAVLPLGGRGADVSTQETVYQLLVSQITQSKKYDVVPQSEIEPFLPESGCMEAACAAEIGAQVKASKVVYGSLNSLGEKIIFQYAVVDVSSGKTVLSDELSAMQVEDLDQVSKRVAASIVQETPVEKTVEVGLVTEQETQEARSRKANSTWGIGFGYIYPQKGYDDKDRIFVWDFRSFYELRHVTVDAVLGIREGVALNIGFLYLMSPKDFSPFIGAGVGFHAVSHESAYDQYAYDHDSHTTSDGFEFLFKGGFLTFRTYDFRVVATVEYSITLNDYDDQGIVVTIGIMRAGKRVFGIF